MGAPRIHIVDLDGAASGEPQNLEIVTQIAAAVLVPVQLGGGIRRLDTIEEILKAGIERVILTTAAVEDPELLREACRRFGDYIVVSVDARDGRVATRGWQQETALEAIEFAKSLSRAGVKRLIYTDIVRDGTLTEPNFTAVAELINATGLPVIAAGGITSVLHVRMLKQLGAEGAIIGRALYTGDIDLKEALAAIEEA